MKKTLNVHALANAKSESPWGYTIELCRYQHYHVKEIHLNCGDRFSYHHHDLTDEIWYLYKGSLLTTIEGKDNMCHEGYCTYIPKGVIHRAQNVGDTDVILLEVQIGEITDNDIIRESDDYGRK